MLNFSSKYKRNQAASFRNNAKAKKNLKESVKFLNLSNLNTYVYMIGTIFRFCKIRPPHFGIYNLTSAQFTLSVRNLSLRRNVFNSTRCLLLSLYHIWCDWKHTYTLDVRSAAQKDSRHIWKTFRLRRAIRKKRSLILKPLFLTPFKAWYRNSVLFLPLGPGSIAQCIKSWIYAQWTMMSFD